ncbi:MAG TPA: PAC2 family protein [Ruania sp.]|nr:PAC2 family protein [Ruania sp.]
MLAAFEGWNDAGSAASSAVAQLSQDWGAEETHRLDVDSFHDFQVNRPIISTDADGQRVLTWPETTVSVATSPLLRRRVVMAEGAEPSMRWREYCRQLLDIAEELGVTTIVCVGALLADVPHTRPIPVQTSSDDPRVQALLEVDSSDYEGPSGITGVLTYEAMQREFHSLNVWAAVPHYVAQPPSPKATLALLTALEEILGEPVPMGELPEDAKAWQDGVDELAGEDPEVAEYVRQLEQAKDTAELPEASGEAIAKEFEKYLRRRDWGG